MQFSDKTANQILTPITTVFRLKEDEIFDEELLARIKDERYSRIPVYADTRDDIIGILFAKDLIGYRASSQKKVKDLCVINNLILIRESMKLDKLLNFLTSKKLILLSYTTRMMS